MTALDSAGQNIGTSETRAFTVDAKAPTVVTVAAASQIKTKGKVTVTFSEQVKNVTTKTFRIYVYGKSKPLKAKVTLDATKTKATLKPAKRTQDRHPVLRQAASPPPSPTWLATR